MLSERLGHDPDTERPEHVGVVDDPDGRKNRDPIALGGQLPHDVEHALVTGAEARVGQPVVDDEHARRGPHRQVDRLFDRVRVDRLGVRVALEDLRPFLDQPLAVRQAEVLLVQLR